VRTTGSLLLLLCGAAAAIGEVSIPVVGQPSPFYGAAGSGVKIETIASPVELAIDDWLLFTIRVSKLVNADDVQRPDLSAIDEFRRDFQVDDEPTTEPDPKGTRVFRYRLRPRSAKVKAIPGLVFPYYDPNLPQPTDRPEFPFRKARAEPIAIRIVKAAPLPEKIIPLEVPAFTEALAEPAPGIPKWIWWLIAAGPPLVAIGWCAVWRAMNPVGDRLARRRRSRAARLALRTLHSLARHTRADPSAVVGCIAIYLAERFDLPGVFRTPADLAHHLRNANASDETIAECVEFLRAADAARFAPSPDVTAEVLIADAKQLIRRQEGEA
jgi:hypothetical protein